MLKADFHVHTFYSDCSNTKPNDLVKVALSKGYDILGVVDHNKIKGGILTKKIAGSKVLIIPGEEIKTDYGDIIIFLSDGKYNRDLIDICERARDLNHFIIVPHPFDFLRIRTSLRNNIKKIESFIDAIEVFNSRIVINWFNNMAADYAKRKKVPRIAGSDAHFLEEIGNTRVYLNCEKNIDSVFNFIRKNKVRIEGKRCSLYSHFKTNFILPLEKKLR